jgi:hypothetical protein
MKIRLVAIFAVLFVAQCAFPAFVVTQTDDANILAQTILGPGVTLSGTPTLTGLPVQSGTFTDFTTGPFTNPVTGASGEITIDQGIILSSGPVTGAMGTYDGGSSESLGGSGDADLSAISGFNTFDAVSLSFDFVPDADQLFIQFVFLSTEYPGYVNTSFNDVFAFFVNGNNVALVPGTTDPVTINSINVGRPVGTNVSNPEYFTQYSEMGVTPFNYGGATILLTATASVNAGEVNNFRFAVADASDSILDSAILIGTGEFSIVDPGDPNNVIPEPGTWVLMISGFAGVLALSRRRASRSKATQ